MTVVSLTLVSPGAVNDSVTHGVRKIVSYTMVSPYIIPQK